MPPDKGVPLGPHVGGRASRLRRACATKGEAGDPVGLASYRPGLGLGLAWLVWLGFGRLFLGFGLIWLDLAWISV